MPVLWGLPYPILCHPCEACLTLWGLSILWCLPYPVRCASPMRLALPCEVSHHLRLALYCNPRNHPKLWSQKSWHLGIRNGPIARGSWNLNQSIEQKVKNLIFEECRYIKDIKVTFWDTAQYFHIGKNLFTIICPGWI